MTITPDCLVRSYSVIYFTGNVNEHGKKIWCVKGDYTDVSEAENVRNRLIAEDFAAHIAMLNEVQP